MGKTGRFPVPRTQDREFELNSGRFKDLVLYISESLADDETFGSTKLNKILYFSDVDAYLNLGRPITGAEYQRNHHGPTAREFLPLVRELESRDWVTVESRRVVDHPQEVVVPTGAIAPNMAQFSTEERAIVDARIAEFRGYTNKQASDESHKLSAGWLTREQGETIPYVSSLVDPEPLEEFALAGLRAMPTE